MIRIRIIDDAFPGAFPRRKAGYVRNCKAFSSQRRPDRVSGICRAFTCAGFRNFLFNTCAAMIMLRADIALREASSVSDAVGEALPRSGAMARDESQPLVAHLSDLVTGSAEQVGKALIEGMESHFGSLQMAHTLPTPLS